MLVMMPNLRWQKKAIKDLIRVGPMGASADEVDKSVKSLENKQLVRQPL